jgi:hypothetical protein
VHETRPVDLPDDVLAFAGELTAILCDALGDDLVGVYAVGSLALGGYVPGESDMDVAAVCRRHIEGDDDRRSLAEALADATARCPARGLELTLYRAEVAASAPQGADFELNVNGGPRMERTVRLTPEGQPAFWYVLDRAIAHRHGVAISGPPASVVFADVPRTTLLAMMAASMRWHRANEKATLYSVLNACRAWRFAAEGLLGSKLEGAAFARTRWHDPALIDAAVDLRHGRPAALDEADVDAFLAHVEAELTSAR